MNIYANTLLIFCCQWCSCNAFMLSRKNHRSYEKSASSGARSSTPSPLSQHVVLKSSNMYLDKDDENCHYDGMINSRENLKNSNVRANKCDGDGTSSGRRGFLSSSLIISSTCMFSNIGPSNAVQGAAEYDMEYYLRDIFNGNKGKSVMSVREGPPAPPARSLQIPFSLLDAECSSQCVTGRELAGVSGKTYEDISKSVRNYRDGAKRAFQVRSPWIEEAVVDEYYFDLTSYATWRVAAEIIPDFTARNTFARGIGKGFLKNARDAGVLKSSSFSTLTESIPAVREVLDVFNSTGFTSSYILGERKKSDSKSKSASANEQGTSDPLFDEFDDDDLKSGLAVNCLISVIRPATLGASLQITGEGSRFSPDYIGTTIAALWAEAGIDVSYESYFVDPEYRPNPKDFFPDEQLFQFTLSKKSK